MCVQPLSRAGGEELWIDPHNRHCPDLLQPAPLEGAWCCDTATPPMSRPQQRTQTGAATGAAPSLVPSFASVLSSSPGGPQPIACTKSRLRVECTLDTEKLKCYSVTSDVPLFSHHVDGTLLAIAVAAFLTAVYSGDIRSWPTSLWIACLAFGILALKFVNMMLSVKQGLSSDANLWKGNACCAHLC